MKKVIIFDIEISGHHLEYITHLMEYLQTKNEVVRESYYFIVHPLFFLKAGKHFVPSITQGIHIIPLEYSTYHKICNMHTKKTSLLQSYRAVCLIRKYSKILFAQTCIALDIDLLYKGLLISRLKGVTINGIWFHPFIRYPIATKSMLIKKLVKNKMLHIILRQNRIGKIFILNDEYSVNKLNIMRRDTFTYLQDPIKIYNHSSISGNILDKVAETKKVKFLLFGDISRRKGALLLLDIILGHLDNSTLKKMQVFIVGRVDKSIREKFYIKLREIKTLNKPAPIVIDRFIEYSEIPDIIRTCDYILMPYLNFYGSSGILNYAAYFGRPVISGNTGLIAELVLKHKLGFISSLDEQSFADILIRLINNNSISNVDESGRKFVAMHTPKYFCKTLLHVE